MDFGPQLVTGRATATNTGTADTTPTFTVAGPLAAPVTITRPDNGTRITYLNPLRTGDQLVIDTRHRTVLLGTVNRRHRVTVTDWDGLTIPPGSAVDFVLGHGGGPNTTARLTVTWRPAWW